MSYKLQSIQIQNTQEQIAYEVESLCLMILGMKITIKRKKQKTFSNNGVVVCDGGHFTSKLLQAFNKYWLAPSPDRSLGILRFAILSSSSIMSILLQHWRKWWLDQFYISSETTCWFSSSKSGWILQIVIRERWSKVNFCRFIA